jgi:hypothetical protein
MAGKLTRFEFPADPPLDPEIAYAYCDGRRAAASGLPGSVNPHGQADEPLAVVWGQGYRSWAADPTGLATVRDFCQQSYGGGYAPTTRAFSSGFSAGYS